MNERVNMNSRWLQAFLLWSAGVAVGLLVGCGDKREHITLAVVPSGPIVFDVPFTQTFNDGSSTNYEANWFQIKVKISNKTPNVIVINALKYTARYRDGDSSLEDEKTFNLSGCFVLNILAPVGKFIPPPDQPDLECDVEMDVPEACLSSEQFVGASASGGDSSSCLKTDTIYISSLPRADNNTYRVQLKVDGWIGELNNPQSRLSSPVLSFTAQ